MVATTLHPAETRRNTASIYDHKHALVHNLPSNFAFFESKLHGAMISTKVLGAICVCKGQNAVHTAVTG